MLTDEQSLKEGINIENLHRTRRRAFNEELRASNIEGFDEDFPFVEKDEHIEQTRESIYTHKGGRVGVTGKQGNNLVGGTQRRQSAQ